MATTISLFRKEAHPPGLGVSRESQPQIAIRPTTAPRLDTPDGRMIAVLDAPLGPGETAQVGYARKEQELGALFAALSVIEARALHQRLSSPKSGDELANKFARLTVERRMRLLKSVDR